MAEVAIVLEDNGKPRPVDLLIGADFMGQLVLDCRSTEGLLTFDTQLG